MSAMDVAALVLFASTLLLAAASPGPGVAALVARVVGRGARGAGAFAAGLILGDLVWLAVAILGLAVVAQTFHEVFLVIKYAGAGYLALLPTLIDLPRVGLFGYVELAGISVIILTAVFGAYVLAAARARTLFRSTRAMRLLNGAGYLVHCSARTLQELPGTGQGATLSIETHVREDQIRLLGFLSDVEREWFRLLQTVQGVGAKVALSVLSTL